MADVRETVSIDELQKFLELDQVDAGNGMLFGASAARKQEPRKNALTLVIATGGSGVSAIKEAIKIADQKLLAEYQNYVEFLVVDSDTDEIEGAKNKNGVRTLYTSTDGAAHRMTLKYGEERRPEFFRKFMPADYDIQKINGKGSSRDRITGKMKLYDVTDDGASTNDARFQDMIAGLFRGKWSPYKKLPVDIMILTGISGGNGSGTFMDLAARAKKVCQKEGEGAVKVYGYIMLPDTAEGFASSDSIKQTFYQNGYAALKELESYMSIGFNGDRKEVIPSTNPVEDITISPTNMLFDYPVLISGNYREAVSMIAETIVNIAGNNAGTFSQESFYSNISSSRLVAMSPAQMCQSGVLKLDACPEDSHQYCGIGYAHAEIPEKIVIPNVVGKVCGSLYMDGSTDGIADQNRGVVFCSQKRKLTKTEFEDAIGILFNVGENVAVDENCLLRMVDDKLWDLSVLPENTNPLTYGDVSGNQFGTWEAAFNAPALVKNGQKEMKQYLDGLYESFLQKAVTVMNQYGPRAMEYLYTGEGADKPTDFAHISIRRILEVVNDTLLDIAKTMTYHPELLPAKGVFGAFVAEKLSKEVDGWKQDKENAIQADIRQEIAESMYGNNGTWITDYQSKVEQFIRSCIRFANVLEYVTTYYSSVGKSVDAGSFAEFAQAQTENNGINLCSDQAMYDWVKSCISQKVASINLVQLKQMLINDFMEHSDQWCSNADGVARKRYDEIMSIACQLGANATTNNGLNLSIQDYFNAALADVPVQNQNQKINEIVEGIMSRLMQKSKPSLRVRNGAFYDVNKNVMLPQSLIRGAYGSQILQSFNAHLGSTVNANNQVIVSPVVDSIVSYQTSVANALCSLEDLPNWEQAYESQRSNTKHLNCGEYVSQYTELSMTEKDELDHVVRKGKLDPEDELLGTTGLSWEHYPSINTIAFQNSFTQFNGLAANTTEAQYRQNVFEKKIEYALNEKIIECVEAAPNVYQYWVNLIPADWNNLNVNAWQEREKGRCVRGKDLFEFLHNQNKHSYASYRKRVVLTGSQIFDGPGFDFTTIIQLQHWNELRVGQEHRNYMKRIMRKNTALYMELEETLYRYYDIRKALEAKEKGYQAYVLTELYLFGCIVVDEDEEQWDVRIDPDGGIQNIITLDWLTKMTGLNAFETGLCEDGLIWPIVYNRFKELGLKMDELDQVRLAYVKKAGQQDPQGFRQMVTGRMEKLQKAYEAYHAAFGSKADPAAEIVKKYNLGKNDAETTADMVQVYQSMLEALAKNKKMFGVK